jgi:LEA14-like dessication related protein
MRLNLPTRMGRMAVALAGAALLSGCWLMFREPEIRLDSIRLTGLSLSGATLVASVMVTNPNSFDLRTMAWASDLDLGDEAESTSWTRLAQGTVDREYRIAARDSAVVEIPLELSYSGVSGAVRSILNRGTFDYRMGGDISVTAPVSRRVPFRRTGRISLLTPN